MKPLRRLSVIDQTASEIRKRIVSGELRGALPGVMVFATDLVVSKRTVVEALRLLEEEKVVVSRGAGHRRVTGDPAGLPGAGDAARPLRIGIAHLKDLREENAFLLRLMGELERSLRASGHELFTPPPFSAAAMREPEKMTAALKTHPVDAWIVTNGPDKFLDLLQDFPVPVLALGGYGQGKRLSYIGADSMGALRDSVRELKKLGHRRIVMIAPVRWRVPVHGQWVTTFLNELVASGIPAGEYNVPAWDGSPSGFEGLMKSLFRVTPPTALIVSDTPQAYAAATFLSRHGLRLGTDVALIVRLDDVGLDWSQPPTARFTFDVAAMTKHAVRWADSLKKGKRPVKQVSIPMSLVGIESLGPPVSPHRGAPGPIRA